MIEHARLLETCRSQQPRSLANGRARLQRSRSVATLECWGVGYQSTEAPNSAPSYPFSRPIRELVAGDWSAGSWKIVRYECDAATDSINVRYEGAYNERGAQLKADAGANDFDPWDLVETSDGMITSTTTVTRECRLSDGEYVVEIKPAPGNYRLTRECGGVMSASHHNEGRHSACAQRF
jgi:hypothetical protein